MQCIERLRLVTYHLGGVVVVPCLEVEVMKFRSDLKFGVLVRFRFVWALGSDLVRHLSHISPSAPPHADRGERRLDHPGRETPPWIWLASWPSSPGVLIVTRQRKLLELKHKQPLQWIPTPPRAN